MKETRTYEGKPCPRGHVRRYVSNNCCTECYKERWADPDARAKQLEYMREYRERLKENRSAVVRVSIPGWGFNVKNIQMPGARL